MKREPINAAIFFVVLLSFVAASCCKQECPITPFCSYTNLSKSGTANCYIVSAAGDYRFTATIIGNGPSGIIADGNFHTVSAMIAPESVALLWQDAPVISDVKLSDKKNQVIFKTACPFEEGNAVIAVKNAGGDIIWSWHIWCTDKPANQVYQNAEDKFFTLLDRTLGATAATPGTTAADTVATYGLFYQWGRKDPFSADNAYVTIAVTSATNGTIANTIKNPSTFYTTSSELNDWHWYEGGANVKNDYLWGNPTGYNTDYTAVKSIYDPCPSGYMVPPGEVWTNFNIGSIFVPNSEGDWRGGCNFFLQGTDNETAWYPAAGSRRYNEGEWAAHGYTCVNWSSAPCMWDEHV